MTSTDVLLQQKNTENVELFATCSGGQKESKHKDYSTPHNFLRVRTKLQDLFPYPLLYARMLANEVLKFGEDFIEKRSFQIHYKKESKYRHLRSLGEYSF